MDIEAVEPLALDSKAALGLATPNLPVAKTKKKVGEGVWPDPNGRDWIVLAQCSGPCLLSGWNQRVAGLRLAVGMVNSVHNILILYLILSF